MADNTKPTMRRRRPKVAAKASPRVSPASQVRLHDVDETLKAIHLLLAQTLLEKIASGEASASVMHVALKFLRDNGVVSDGTRNPVIRELGEAFDGLTIEDLEDKDLPFGRG